VGQGTPVSPSLLPCSCAAAPLDPSQPDLCCYRPQPPPSSHRTPPFLPPLGAIVSRPLPFVLYPSDPNEPLSTPHPPYSVQRELATKITSHPSSHSALVVCPPVHTRARQILFYDHNSRQFLPSGQFVSLRTLPAIWKSHCIKHLTST
jgi:hypothetical protein